jgi:4'-phosphopantetheinyl transferase
VSWCAPPSSLVLDSNAVHVWRADLNESPAQIDHFLNTLAPDERTRAERFYFQRDRGHFIVARGVLRATLGKYLHRAPESLIFCYSSHGKPALAPESGGDAIRFNLSHSHDIALYAFTRTYEIGIDVEWIRREIEAEQIAERFFSPQEVAALHALPKEQRCYAFFLCWTRKEAYIKARGEGLSLPLDQFDVSLTPEQPAALLATRPDPNEARKWSLRELTPGPGYVAALATERDDWSLLNWQWPSGGTG